MTIKFYSGGKPFRFNQTYIATEGCVPVSRSAPRPDALLKTTKARVRLTRVPGRVDNSAPSWVVWLLDATAPVADTATVSLAAAVATSDLV